MVESFSEKSGLKLNHTKTYATTFDFGTTRTFFPDGCLSFPSGKCVEFVGVLKLLGVKIDKNLTFDSFVKDKRKSGFFSLWQLKRLEATGISRRHMKAAYEIYVRSKIEYGLLPCIHMLTDEQTEKIEAVQRRATKTILGIKKRYGPDVPSYEARLDTLKLLRVKDRTVLRFNDFALKAEFDPRLQHHFHPSKNLHSMNTRGGFFYEEQPFKTDHRKNSPLLRMVRYINQLPSTPDQRFAERSGG